MGAFLGGTFVKKMHVVGLHPQKQMPYLTMFNEKNFFKTQRTRLGAVVASYNGLEWALIERDHFLEIV